jgi:hypothetical protein
MRRGKEDRERRRKKAEERNAERSKRTPVQQLHRLDERIGEGVGMGACKERHKLRYWNPDFEDQQEGT